MRPHLRGSTGRPDPSRTPGFRALLHSRAIGRYSGLQASLAHLLTAASNDGVRSCLPLRGSSGFTPDSLFIPGCEPGSRWQPLG